MQKDKEEDDHDYSKNEKHYRQGPLIVWIEKIWGYIESKILYCHVEGNTKSIFDIFAKKCAKLYFPLAAANPDDCDDKQQEDNSGPYGSNSDEFVEIGFFVEIDRRY